MEDEAKSSNLGVVYWNRECLVGPAGEPTSEQMIPYLGISQTPARRMLDGHAGRRLQLDGRASKGRGRMRRTLPIRGLIQLRSAQ